MSKREDARATLLEEISKCRACRFCVDVCPTYQSSEGVESLSAYGRLQTMKYLLKGALRFDDAMSYVLYSCLQCKRCERVCKSKGQNLDVCRIIQLGRYFLSNDLLEGSQRERI